MLRKEKAQIKKEKKRLKIAMVLLLILFVILFFGILQRFDWQSINFFESEKFLNPQPGKSTEQELMESFSQADIRVISLSVIGDKELEASISGGIKILLKTDNIGQEVSSLQQILSRFKIEGRMPKKIDLRFQKPVVTF